MPAIHLPSWMRPSFPNRLWLAALLLGMLTALAPAARADMPESSERPELWEAIQGSLVIIGGSERFDNHRIWSEIVRLAGGEGARIAVFPTASGVPVQYGNDVVRVLNRAGADAFVVPIAHTGFDRHHSEAAQCPLVAESVRQSRGVFFVGGEQARIRECLVTAEGHKTPVLDAIWDVYRRGGVIAGTSAGAAIMSRVMFRAGKPSLAAMVEGVSMGRELDAGLGFLHPDWFVDQHMLVRGRFARTLVAMHQAGIRYGVGVDEDSALVVHGTHARVIGYRGVIVLDLSEATHDEQVDGFNLKNVKLSYLDRGDSFHLRTLDVTPSTEKFDDRKIEPFSAGFHPTYRHRIFCNDILGNTSLLDVMSTLIDNRHNEAIGLAYDGAAARRGNTPGFEFRFYREHDSVGWETESFGGDDYTVLNIHLDIRPITVKGPLYE